MIDRIDDLTSEQRLEDILYYEEWRSVLSFSLDFPDVIVCSEWNKASGFIKWAKEQGDIKDLIFMPCEDCTEWSPKTCEYVRFVESSPEVNLHVITKIEKINESKDLYKSVSEVWDTVPY